MPSENWTILESERRDLVVYLGLDLGQEQLQCSDNSPSCRIAALALHDWALQTGREREDVSESI